MDKNSRDPIHCWLVLMKASHATAKYLYAGLEETGIDETDFRVLEVLLNKARKYDRPKGQPYAGVDQYGR